MTQFFFEFNPFMPHNTNPGHDNVTQEKKQKKNLEWRLNMNIYK